MIISNSRDFVFINLHMSGGTSVERALSPYLNDQDILPGGGGTAAESEKAQLYRDSGLHPYSTASEIHNFLGADEYRSKFVFTVVRHPFFLVRSLFAYSLKRLEILSRRSERNLLSSGFWNGPEADQLADSPGLKELNLSFIEAAGRSSGAEDPLTAFARTDSIWQGRWLQPQVWRICVEENATGEMMWPDATIDITDLATIWPGLMKKFDLMAELGHQDEADPENYRISDEFCEIVEKRMAPDFEQLGYTRDPASKAAPLTIYNMAPRRIDIGSIHLAIEDRRVPAKTREAMERGRYEFKEREIVRRMLRKGDRVIELGAGMGVVSLTIAQLVGADAIRSFEANPVIIELARENAAANDLPVTFLHAIASPRVVAEQTPYIDFFLLKSFEASSTRQVSPSQEAVQVRTTPLEDEIVDLEANVLVLDIEGFETEIIEKTDLSSIEKLILEIHPKIIGMEVCVALINRLEAQGLILRKDLAFGDVLAFERGAAPASMGGGDLFRALADLEDAARELNWTRALELAKPLDGDIADNAYAQHRLAQIARQAGEPALLRFEKALHLGSEDFLLHTDLAGQYLERGLLGKASDMLTDLERLFPRSQHLPTLKARLKRLG